MTGENKDFETFVRKNKEGFIEIVYSENTTIDNTNTIIEIFNGILKKMRENKRKKYFKEGARK